MSTPNPFQPWKQQNRPPGIPPNLSTNNSYGKLPAVAHQTMQSIQQQQQHQQQQHLMLSHPAPVIQSVAAASSPSSSAISSSTGGSAGGAAGMGTAGMSEFLSQLGANKLTLSKLSASYGLATNAGEQPLNHHTQQLLQQQQQQQLQSSPDDCATDTERELRIQQIFESAIGDNSKKQIVDILEKISSLRPPERLLLYLRMPGGYPETDPLRQSQNPLGTRSEINHTINWVRSHLEHDPNVSIPKQEVYEDYIAFCERIDIKPLSTADFGKVMKQVFPGIRPRRLGTRGHSRYCYAAMRKATKLAAPKLPDLSTAAAAANTSSSGEQKNHDPEDHVPTDEEAWKVIKVWAEAMLPSSFGTINELAGFINKNNLNSPSCIASRQLLQKKLMQRELKERKKMNAAAMKKRRKKRRKTLSSSADPEQQHEPSEATPVGPCNSTSSNAASASTAEVAEATENLLQQMIKHEPGVDFTDEDNNNTAPSGVGATSVITLKQQQQMQQSTNVICDTGIVGQTAVGGREMRSPAEEYTIFCKKVRQAQQLKAAAQLQQQMPQPPAPPPPQQHHVIPSPLRIPSAAAKRAASIAHMTRQKRLRLLQQQQQRSLEAQNNSAPRYDELGNLILIESQDLVTSSSKEDFIIPRERVISICNMDKNALDDYLNCDEENSQDQDQELLQYFPEENQGAGQQQQQQQGTVETGAAGYGGMFEDSEQNLKLSQLRSMLELNMAQSSGTMDKQQQQQQQQLQIGGQLDGFDGTVTAVSQQHMSLQPGSAAASLAMLSQRHHGGSLSASGGSEGKKNNVEGFNNLGNCSGQSGPPQSPNGRRKNCSFVPISAGPQSPRVPPANKQQQNNSSTPNASPFVSPRNTPIHRKSKATNNGLTLSILHQNQSGFHQPQRAPFMKNELSASAPPSPSLLQGYRFSVNPGMLSNQNAPLPSFQPICGPSSQMQSMPGGGGGGSLESRSSSVPLIPNYDGYSHSNFTSISQTPVPSECDDFSDPNNILDMLNEPSSSSNVVRPAIKLEDSEQSIADMLDQHEDMFTKSSIPYSSLSRSVPSTPLPHQMPTNQHCGGPTLGSNGYSSKSLFELPKSVPSTPIGNGRNAESMFQYSPETSRDYLINGNSVERATGKLNSFYQNQSSGDNGSVGISNNSTITGQSGSANGTAGGPSTTTIPSGPSSASGTEMSILSDGIDSFTDALIGSDPLRFL